MSDTTTSGSSVTQVTKNISWNDECYDDDYYAAPKIVSVLLPTAPRSARILDDSTIPQHPPFLAYLSNLPYDLNEQDLQEYFEESLECEVVSVRLPREDGDTGRMRGFGYIEFREREHLIAAMSMPDPQLRNRKIRIDVSNEQDQRRAGGRNRYDNFGASSESHDTNWRGGGGRQQEDGGGGGGGGEYGSRRGNFGHNRERRERDSSQDGGGSGEGGGNWRSGDRPRFDSPPARRDRDREPRERDQSGRDRYGGGGGGRRNGYEDRPRREEPVPEDRPRLKLQPRTLPLPDIKPRSEDEEDKSETVNEPPPPRPKPVPVPSAQIFGAAKPVDTAAKDRAIEERLERERLQKQKDEEEKAKLEQERKELDKEEHSQDGTDGGERDGDENESVDNDKPTAPITPVEKKEVISWRRNADDPEEPSRTQSPPRRRFSPDRRRRPNGTISSS